MFFSHPSSETGGGEEPGHTEMREESGRGRIGLGTCGGFRGRWCIFLNWHGALLAIWRTDLKWKLHSQFSIRLLYLISVRISTYTQNFVEISAVKTFRN